MRVVPVVQAQQTDLLGRAGVDWLERLAASPGQPRRPPAQRT